MRSLQSAPDGSERNARPDKSKATPEEQKGGLELLAPSDELIAVVAAVARNGDEIGKPAANPVLKTTHDTTARCTSCRIDRSKNWGSLTIHIPAASQRRWR